MFTKILLVATFIMLIWNSYQISSTNEFIKAQDKEVTALQQKIKTQQEAQSECLIKQVELQANGNNVVVGINEKLKRLEESIKRTQKSIKKIKTDKPIAKPKPSDSRKNSNNKADADKNTAKANAKEGNDFKTVLAKRLETVNKLYKDETIDEASAKLVKLKGLVWKNRKDTSVTKKSVLALLSAIDTTVKNWKNQDANYDLNNVNSKHKALFVNAGVSR